MISLTLNESQLEAFADILLPLLRVGDIIALKGHLGAGKTSFSRQLIQLACKDKDLAVPSPTYTLVQDYYPQSYPVIIHGDLYRLEDEGSFYELGLEDELDRAFFLIEWPDKLPQSWQIRALSCDLSFDTDPEKRRVDISGPEDWQPRLIKLQSVLKLRFSENITL